MAPARWQYFAKLGQGSPGHYICSNQCLICGSISLLGFRGPRIKGGVDKISTNKIPASCPCDLMLCYPRNVHCKGRNVSIRRHWFHWTGSWYYPLSLWTPCASELTDKEGSDCAGLGEQSWPHGENGFLLQNGVKEDNAWNKGDPLGGLCD